TRRLMDHFHIETSPGRGTCVTIAKRLPRGQRAPTREITRLVATGVRRPAPTAARELQVQERELLMHLSELRSREEEVAALTAELESTNRGVVALYAELDERAEQLRQASELKSRFLSHMSHEFRTPLNSILAISRLLLDRIDGDLTQEQERQVAYIRASAQHLTELVDDLLDLAKVEAGKVEVRPGRFAIADLLGTLRGVLKPLQTNDQVQLVFEDATALPPIVTDEGKLSQILRNLVSNALKYTEHGEVRVAVRHEPAAGSVVFAVSDTGVGIDPEDQERIFQEFVQIEHRLQLRVRGTGLGLPLSRRLAGLLGGELTVASRPGLGSTFTLTLPLAPGESKPGTGDAAAARRILVIEDEEAARYVLRQLLGTRQGELIEATDGTEGLRRAQADRPALIFLDLRLPGLSGFQVIEKLAGDVRTAEIPVVVCTSSVLDAAETARLGHARAIISKAELSRDVVSCMVANFARTREGR
ncbi:MAG: response regulator, partial [Alphaproteobacteria bacterium]|nr:response regulator [Alphaproteobacteria bacterium]